MSFENRPRSRPVEIGEGYRSVVTRDKGYVYKMPWNRGLNKWGVPLAIDVLGDEYNKWKALKYHGIPTVDKYSIEVVRGDGTVEPYTKQDRRPDDTYRAKMSDLSNGGRNLVINTADLNWIKTEGTEEQTPQGLVNIQTLKAIVAARPQPHDPDAFFDELKRIVTTADNAVVKLPNSNQYLANGIGFPFSGGLFMILGPDGTLRTKIADLEDGVNEQMNNILFYDRKSWRHLLAVEAYLTFVVLEFFPQFLENAQHLLSDLSQGTFPLNLVGETDLAIREKITYKGEWDRTKPTREL